MKLVLPLTYDIDFKDEDIDCVNKIAKTLGKISKSIYFWLHYLSGNKPEKI